MGINIQDPQVIAEPGWTSADLIHGVAAANLSNTYDLITLLTGFANQYRGQALDDYRQQLRELINRAVELAGGDENRILVISIPDWGQTPYAKNFNRALIAEQIDAYNQISRAEASQAGAHYVDITSKARVLVKQPGMLASDELHPSGLQYTAWMESIFPEALAALG
jgi:lysophospholipase L1-like esterase